MFDLKSKEGIVKSGFLKTDAKNWAKRSHFPFGVSAEVESRLIFGGIEGVRLRLLT